LHLLLVQRSCGVSLPLTLRHCAPLLVGWSNEQRVWMRSSKSSLERKRRTHQRCQPQLQPQLTAVGFSPVPWKSDCFASLGCVQQSAGCHRFQSRAISHMFRARNFHGAMFPPRAAPVRQPFEQHRRGCLNVSVIFNSTRYAAPPLFYAAFYFASVPETGSFLSVYV
jgi:hypothetical protein